jgi:hypothetical protein
MFERSETKIKHSRFQSWRKITRASVDLHEEVKGKRKTASFSKHDTYPTFIKVGAGLD